MRKSFQKALREVDEGQGYEALDRLENMKLSDSAEYVARGQRLARANRYHAALDDFNAAISGDCKDPQAYFGLGEVLSALGRHEETIGALQKVGIKSLSRTDRPANLVPLYEGMVIDLFKCGRIQEVKRYGKAARREW